MLWAGFLSECNQQTAGAWNSLCMVIHHYTFIHKLLLIFGSLSRHVFVTADRFLSLCQRCLSCLKGVPSHCPKYFLIGWHLIVIIVGSSPCIAPWGDSYCDLTLCKFCWTELNWIGAARGVMGSTVASQHCVEFACSTRIWVRSVLVLLLPPTVQIHEGKL